MNKIILNRKAQKQIKNLPNYILTKLQRWAEDVEEFGIEEIRKIPGYHDEPLQAIEKTKGQLDYQRLTGLFISNIKIK
ncbi:hypothetical protein [Desulfobacula sp.]|uniref:hypothetical protein n=1 Tax=Desulfobacula sp. TaxID=2593537 RepID=UPI002714FD67|nr:hypothetical protein [Desulfobacula sp.]